MNAVRKEPISIGFFTALARHRQNRLDFVGISWADVQRMRDQKQRGFGMGGRVRGRGTDRWSRLGLAWRRLVGRAGATSGPGLRALHGSRPLINIHCFPLLPLINPTRWLQGPRYR